jgi:hypothetical protein
LASGFPLLAANPGQGMRRRTDVYAHPCPIFFPFLSCQGLGDCQAMSHYARNNSQPCQISQDHASAAPWECVAPWPELPAWTTKVPG